MCRRVFFVSFLWFVLGIRQLGYRCSGEYERRFDVDFPVEENGRSRDAHHPEVGCRVDFAYSGFEVVDRCVHDVGGGMVV